MEYCNESAANWPHPVPLHPPARGDGYFYGGAADFMGSPAANPLLGPAYRPYHMPASGGRAAVDANGYQHVGPPLGYPPSSAAAVTSSGGASSNFYYGAPTAVSPSAGATPTQLHPSPAMINPPIPGLFGCGGGFSMNPVSTNRAIRNAAEKQRRDKLNAFINELAALVPMVSNSPKRMDKTSVLRLAVTFLRMQWLLPATVDSNSRLPQFLLDRVNWFQMLVNHIDGSLLVVTSVGKIVFITHNIEDILGYTQLELLGLSLYNITSVEDHAELKKWLTPDENDENTTDSIGELEDLKKVIGSESVANQSYSSRPCSTTSRSSICKASCSSQCNNNDMSAGYEKQRRSFFLRLSHRNPARSEKPQYELVHVQGHLMVPRKFSAQAQKKSRKHKVEVSSTNSNEIFLVAIMERLPGRRVTELSMLEPSKDEYVTRHTLHGKILYSDHRISTVAGYLSEEVNGLQAFNYMHKDDVTWVAISLFQMFAKGDAFGLSCYRLRTKTGSYIYLKSHGYLEFNASTESYGSFICVNSMVSKEEGERAILEMKKRYTPVIESKDTNGYGIPSEFFDMMKNQKALPGADDSIDMSSIIEALISHALISHVGELKPEGVHEDPEKSGLPQYLFAKLISKRLPPVTVHLESIRQAGNRYGGAVSASPTSSCAMSPSPPTSPAQQPQPPLKQERQSWPSAGSPPAACGRVSQDRPSVLRIAPSSSSCKPVTVYPVDNLISSSTGDTGCGDSGAYDGGCGDCGQRIIEPEFIKQEAPDDEGAVGVISSSVTAAATKAAGRARSGAAKETTGGDRAGVLRAGAKRPLDARADSPPASAVPTRSKRFKEEAPLPAAALAPSSEPLHFDPGSFGELDYDVRIKSDLNVAELGDLPLDSFDIRPGGEIYGFFNDVNQEALDHKHMELRSTIRMQGAQLTAIANHLDGVNLDDVSFSSKQFYLDEVSQLKHEHETQGQYLQKIHHQVRHNFRCNSG